MVKLSSPSPVWVEFKYERLPIFCYRCGKVDHDERDCLLWIRSKEILRAEDKQYGPWLRATQERLQRPQLVMASRLGGVGTSLSKDDNRNQSGWDSAPATRRIVEMVAPDCAKESDDVALTAVNMGVSVMVSKNHEETIPKISQNMDFEEKLREIDEAVEMNTELIQGVSRSTNSSDALQVNGGFWPFALFAKHIWHNAPVSKLYRGVPLF